MNNNNKDNEEGKNQDNNFLEKIWVSLHLSLERDLLEDYPLGPPGSDSNSGQLNSPSPNLNEKVVEQEGSEDSSCDDSCVEKSLADKHHSMMKEFKRIILAYGESTRFYHNTEHLCNVFQAFSIVPSVVHSHGVSGNTIGVKNSGSNNKKSKFNFSNISPILGFAVFYHDMVYDATSPPAQNEKESAKESLRYLNHLLAGRDHDLSDHVSQMILSTIDHKPHLNSPEEKYFLDADLSILGATEYIYFQAAANIRKEYAHFNDEDFNRGRSAVLQKFLERDTIYYSSIFQSKCEQQARTNIKKEILKLSV